MRDAKTNVRWRVIEVVDCDNPNGPTSGSNPNNQDGPSSDSAIIVK